MGRLWNEMMPQTKRTNRQPEDEQAVAESEIDDATDHGFVQLAVASGQCQWRSSLRA